MLIFKKILKSIMVACWLCLLFFCIITTPSFAEETFYILTGSHKIGKVEDGKVYYYITDPLGSPRVILDESQNTVWSSDYLPFGRALNEQSAAHTETNKFTGKPFDEATGLYYYGARYYDPIVGRFASVDSARQFPSPYNYCANNPLRHIDPTGNLIEFNWHGEDTKEVKRRFGASIEELEKIIKESANEYLNTEYAILGPVDFVNDESFLITVDFSWERIDSVDLGGIYEPSTKTMKFAWINFAFAQFWTGISTPEFIKMVTFHEFSHVYDHLKGIVSDETEEFYNVQQEYFEKNKIEEFKNSDAFKKYYVSAAWELQLAELYAYLRMFKRFDYPDYLKNHQYSNMGKHNIGMIKKYFRQFVFFTGHRIKGTPAGDVYKLFETKFQN